MKLKTLLIVGISAIMSGVGCRSRPAVASAPIDSKPAVTSLERKPTVAPADIRVVVERNESGSTDFKFRNVPPPSRSDVATRARFTIVDGERDSNGGDLRDRK